MLGSLTSTLTWALSLIFFSFAFLSFSGWTTLCCIVCDGSWLLWNTQEILPSSGAASFRQNYCCFLHALFPPGSSVRFTWSGWDTGQPSLWVTSLSCHVRIHWVSTQNTSPQVAGNLVTAWKLPMFQKKSIYPPLFLMFNFSSFIFHIQNNY